jgi:prepilin-type N-terminal cleavage/methylation domain-containing protein
LHSPRFATGFTLPELLIGVALIGLIALFTLPKVTQNIEKTNYTAIYKEAYSSFTDVTQDATQQNQAFATNAQVLDWLASRLDFETFCPTNALTEGCRTTTAENNWHTLLGFKLKNKSVVMLDIALASNKPLISLMIDVDGDRGNNADGDDIFQNGCNLTPSASVMAGTATAVQTGQCGVADTAKSQWQ